jgi:uncharacterized Zn finger protein
MARSACPKCGKNSFELVTQDNISGSRFKFNFVQCSACGTVVGVVDFNHLPTVLEEVKQEIAAKPGATISMQPFQVINSNLVLLGDSVAALRAQVNKLEEEVKKK